MSKHVNDLDNFKEGDRVIVSFFISGNAWEKDGVVRYINDIVAYKIEPYVSNQGPQTSQNSAPSPQPTQGAQTPPQSSNASQQSNAAAPPIPPASGVNTDDLPF